MNRRTFHAEGPCIRWSDSERRTPGDGESAR
jgi:hypothetical protein